MLVVPSGYLVDVFAEFGLKAEVVPNILDFRSYASDRASRFVLIWFARADFILTTGST